MRSCIICSHPNATQIASDLLSGLSQRAIAKRYDLKKSMVAYRVLNHVSGPLRRLIAAEQSLHDDLVTVQPVVNELRRLNQRVERVMSIAEASKDHEMVLKANREWNRNLELIARISGELPLTPTAAVAVSGSGPVKIEIVRFEPTEHRLPQPNGQVIALPAPAEDKPN